MRMKRAISIFLCILMLSMTVTSLAGCSLIDELFFRHPERAVALTIPTLDEIDNIKVTARVGGTHTVPKQDYELILDYLSRLEPYDESYTDSVYGYYVYEIRINLGGDARFYYLYEEGGQLFLEVPYSGIYRVDSALYDHIGRYFE